MDFPRKYRKRGTRENHAKKGNPFRNQMSKLGNERNISIDVRR